MTSLCIFRWGAALARPTPPRRPRLDHRSNPVDAAGDAMPESTNDASGTRFSAGGGNSDDDDDDEDDDERADIVDDYRARIIASVRPTSRYVSFGGKDSRQSYETP